MSVNVPVPAKTRSKDVHVVLTESEISVIVTGHPLTPILAGDFFDKVDKPYCEWHLEGDFDDRRLVRTPRVHRCLLCPHEAGLRRCLLFDRASIPVVSDDRLMAR